MPDFVWTLAAAAVLAAVALTTRAVSDPSPWLHLKVGQYLLDGGRFGAVDPWAPFAQGHYEPTQWLPSVVTARLYATWGLPAVAWSRTAGIVALALALLLWLRRFARPALTLPLSLLALAGSWPALTERPQVAGFVLLVVTIGAWWASAHDGRTRWWLVPLTWLAACVHGVWSIGLGLGALVVAGLVLARTFEPRERSRMVVCLSACVAVTALTPLGPRLTLSPLTVGGNARQFVSEWMASSARTPSVALTLVALAAVFALWARSGRRPEAWQLLMWLAAIALTLVMQRTVPVAAILAAFLLTEAVPERALSHDPLSAGPEAGSPVPRRLPRREVAGLLAGTLVALLLAAPLAAVRARDARGVPVALASSLRALPVGTHVVVDGDMSGWVLFAAPGLRPVFDIRVEVYPPAHVRGFIAALRAQPGWSAYLQRTSTRAALVKQDAPLASALTDQWHWRTVGTSDGYSLLVAP
ncbi:hypothetical protein ACFUC1_18005 [Pedococcus sp. NPDC057267]|uniref:hypothetical protein n=1 Tax=Pedococcus sp. NPDC057267 TaxID=3346077 RepID=UPI00364021A2